jgi:hypothetical protein
MNRIRIDGKTDENESLSNAVKAYLENVKVISQSSEDFSGLQTDILRMLSTLLQLPQLASSFNVAGTKNVAKHLSQISADLEGNYSRWLTLAAWTVVSQYHNHNSLLKPPSDGFDWIRKWKLDQSVTLALVHFGVHDDTARHKTTFMSLAVKFQDWYLADRTKTVSQILRGWFLTPEIRESLKVNFYEDILWYHQESFLELIWWMELTQILKVFSTEESNRVTAAETVLALKDVFKAIQARHQKSFCQVEKLLGEKE